MTSTMRHSVEFGPKNVIIAAPPSEEATKDPKEKPNLAKVNSVFDTLKNSGGEAPKPLTSSSFMSRMAAKVEGQQNLRSMSAKQRASINIKEDENFNEIRRALKKRSKNKNLQETIEEYYVDPSRLVAVQTMGSQSFVDLKSLIGSAGLRRGDGELERHPGEPDDIMYLKQSEYFISKNLIEEALYYSRLSIAINPCYVKALYTNAKCHTLLGQWKEALASADMVLSIEKCFVKAILVKAEALFNLCQFEHSLVLFHKGQLLAPEVDDFRLGIQNCRQVIFDALKNEDLFNWKGIENLFGILRKTNELREHDLYQDIEQKKTKNSLTISNLISIIRSREDPSYNGNELRSGYELGGKTDEAMQPKTKMMQKVDQKLQGLTESKAQMRVNEIKHGEQCAMFKHKASAACTSNAQSVQLGPEQRIKRLKGLFDGDNFVVKCCKPETCPLLKQVRNGMSGDIEQESLEIDNAKSKCGTNFKTNGFNDLNELGMNSKQIALNRNFGRMSNIATEEGCRKKDLCTPKTKPSNISTKMTSKKQKRRRSTPLSATTKDRLFIDKVYLSVLTKAITQKPGWNEDWVQEKVVQQANDALTFLISREEFWEQLNLGESALIKN